MDPQVCGKLFTLHRKGNRVDVEALRDRIPLRQGARKGPQMGSHGYRRLRWRKSILVDASGRLAIFLNLQAKNQGWRSCEAPTRPQDAPPQGRALEACGLLGTLLTYLFVLYIHIYSRTLRESHKNTFPPPQPSVPVRSHLGAQGDSITEGFYINSIALLMKHEQFTTDLRVHSQQLDGFFSLSLILNIMFSSMFLEFYPM